MNPIIKINLKTFKEISWPVVFLFLANNVMSLSSQQVFIISIGVLAIMIGFAKKIIFPQVKGMNFYLLVIVYATVIGFATYEIRNVFRDLYYILPTITIIIIGYYLQIIHKRESSILKTVVLCGTILSTYRFIKLFTDISILVEDGKLRSNFDVASYEVIIAFLITFCVMFTSYKNILFKKWINAYCFIIMLAQLLLSLARSVWIELIVGCVLILILDAYVNRNLIKFFKRISIIIIIATIGITFFVRVTPESAIETFTEKFDNTFNEMDSEQKFDSTTDAMNNWRGYENQSAKEQWNNSGVVASVFGEGLGKGIYLKYIPYSWKDMTVNNEIPILHSGYYTILSKCGMVGVFALIWFMFANVLYGLRLLKKRKDIRVELYMLIVIEVIFMIQTSVVRGPISQTANVVWGIMVGWISSMTLNKNRV